LHVFADASTKAYGAVAFLCNDKHCSFVMARTRAAPLKFQTLPRLELMAATIAKRLAMFIQSSLITLYELSVKLWSDLNRQGVQWKFIPKCAPWHGGFWERLIGLTKTAIKKVLGRAFVSLSTLQTMIVKIEAYLNNRPLTYVSSEIDDPVPLTPAHLLYGRCITTLPHLPIEEEEVDDPSYEDSSKSELSRRAKIQALLLQHFWTRWKNEYITSLREYHRNTGNNIQTIKVGDVVQVHNEGSRVH